MVIAFNKAMQHYGRTYTMQALLVFLVVTVAYTYDNVFFHQ